MRYNSLIPELSVADIDRTKHFYIDVLGFSICYEREENKFVFVALEDNQMMLEQIKPQAEKKIQTQLVLEAIVKAENIVASDADIDAEIEDLAKLYKMEADKVKEMIGEEGKKQMAKEVVIKKAVKFVVDNAVEK